MQGETVLYNPTTKKFCVLNGTAAFVWEKMASVVTADEISGAVCQHYGGIDAKAAARDVQETLKQFEDLDLVAAQD